MLDESFLDLSHNNIAYNAFRLETRFIWPDWIITNFRVSFCALAVKVFYILLNYFLDLGKFSDKIYIHFYCTMFGGHTHINAMINYDNPNTLMQLFCSGIYWNPFGVCLLMNKAFKQSIKVETTPRRILISECYG